MFKDSAIILDAIRRSFLNKSATAAMFNLFIPAVFTEQYIESMGQSQQTQLYCGRMAYVY
jgi:hypothetical protein